MTPELDQLNDEFDLDVRTLPVLVLEGATHAMGNTHSNCGTNCNACQATSEGTCGEDPTKFTNCGSCTCQHSDRTCGGCKSFEGQCPSAGHTECKTCGPCQ